jgi:hypothetical protein
MTGRKGGTEDVLAIEVTEWTPVLEQQARELREKFDVMDPERVEKSLKGADEYPEPSSSQNPLRQQQLELDRAKIRRERKKITQADRDWRERQKRMPT